MAALGVTLDSAAKIPDFIVHHTARNWLLLTEAVTSAGPVDGKRRKELKDLFAGCKAHLAFVTAFENRRAMPTFVSHFAWESEVWIAKDPDHMNLRYESCPSLRDMQAASFTAHLRQISEVFSPRIKALAPPDAFQKNVAMNAALALNRARLSGSRLCRMHVQLGLKAPTA